MTAFAVPYPAPPDHVEVRWTPTNAACVVECSRCRKMHAFYTTVLRKFPDAIADAIAEHKGCQQP